MIFLGILLNSETFTLSITQVKVSDIVGIIQIWLEKETASPKELQSILGKLYFVSCCVRSGRILVSRMLNWLRSFPDISLRSTVPTYVRLDLMWWYTFRHKYNDLSMIPDSGWSIPDEIIASDACLTGYGGWNSTRKKVL